VDGFLAFAPELAAENDGFAATSFEHLAALEAGHFWFVGRNALIAWAMRRYFPAAQKFLEIGCGTGFVLQGLKKELPNLELSGSEIYCRGLDFARARLPGVELVQMDARHIPFESEFDVIGAFDVLEHIHEDQRVLGEMFRACRPGGGVLITVPQHRFLWSHVDDYSFHKRRYSRRELVEKVRRAGFSVSRVTSFVSLLLPMMLLSRLRTGKSPANFDPTAELRIGGLANAICGAAMTAERAAIRLGVSPPAGGSILLAARKPEA
jgi:SAM-dependent methyltransferase